MPSGLSEKAAHLEQTTHTFSNPEWFAWSSSITVFCTCVLAFTIQSQPSIPAANRVDYPNFFISSAIDFPPAELMGTFFLSIGALLLAYSMLIRYLEVKRSLRQHHTGGKESEKERNKWSAVAGALSVCGALGVCAVPLHTGFATHMVFALTFFISGGVYQYMQNWIDRETGLAREVPPWVEQMRKYTSWGAVGIMLLLVPAALVYRAVTGHFVAYPPVVALCAVAEILTMLFLLLNLSTYGISVMGLHLDITLTKIKPEDEASTGLLPSSSSN